MLRAVGSFLTADSVLGRRFGRCLVGWLLPARPWHLRLGRHEVGAAALFEAKDLREWRDQDVLDPQGDKIGSLEAV